MLLVVCAATDATLDPAGLQQFHSSAEYFSGLSSWSSIPAVCSEEEEGMGDLNCPPVVWQSAGSEILIQETLMSCLNNPSCSC